MHCCASVPSAPPPPTPPPKLQHQQLTRLVAATSLPLFSPSSSQQGLASTLRSKARGLKSLQDTPKYLAKEAEKGSLVKEICYDKNVDLTKMALQSITPLCWNVKQAAWSPVV